LPKPFVQHLEMEKAETEKARAKKIKKTLESKSKFHKESNQKTLHDV